MRKYDMKSKSMRRALGNASVLTDEITAELVEDTAEETPAEKKSGRGSLTATIILTAVNAVLTLTVVAVTAPFLLAIGLPLLLGAFLLAVGGTAAIVCGIIFYPQISAFVVNDLPNYITELLVYLQYNCPEIIEFLVEIGLVYYA